MRFLQKGRAGFVNPPVRRCVLLPKRRARRTPRPSGAATRTAIIRPARRPKRRPPRGQHRKRGRAVRSPVPRGAPSSITLFADAFGAGRIDRQSCYKSRASRSCPETCWSRSMSRKVSNRAR